MTVKELIFLLKEMPQDAKVKHIWDGEPRTEVETVWLARDGFVATAGYNEVVYSEGSSLEFTDLVLGVSLILLLCVTIDKGSHE